MANEQVSAQLSLTGSTELDASYAPSTGQGTRTIRSVGNQLQLAAAFNQNTPQKPAKFVDVEITLGAGATIIDLTAAPVVGALSGGQPAATEDLTGRALFAMVMSAPKENAGGNIIVKPAASNGYALFGAGGLFEVIPGQTEVNVIDNDAASLRGNVAANFKDIEISGTAGDKISLVLMFI